MSGSAEPIIQVESLTKHFHVRLGAFGQSAGVVHALDSVTFDVRRGETLSLVGESGCGKTTAGLAVLQLVRPVSGRVIFDGVDLVPLPEKALRKYRKRLQIVFQDPHSTLNPRMTVGDAIAEPLRFHGLASRKAIAGEVDRLLSEIGLSSGFAQRYPHELSGGQSQRAAIARALACAPDVLVCDEAISALDVSVQAQVINLLQDLQERHGLTYLFIAHDLAVVRHMSDRVAVMYLGRLAELAPRDALFGNPLHPYTQALLSAIPEADPVRQRERARTALPVSGEVPSPLNPPPGCRFHARCPIAREICAKVVPDWREIAPGHSVACHAVDAWGAQSAAGGAPASRPKLQAAAAPAA